MDQDNHFSDSEGFDIEAVEFTESLASSLAFENYLFTHMAQRRATHTMHEKSQPISLTKQNVQSIIPEEMRDIFSDTDHTISNLEILQDESHDMSYFFMRYTLDDEHHSFTYQSDQDHATYTRPNSYGEPASYTLSSAAPVAFLAGLTYAREYDTLHAVEQRANSIKPVPGMESTGLSAAPMFTLEDSTIAAPRIGNSDMIERLIMTLSQFDGISQVETSGLIPAGNQILLATLRQHESPHLTHASNELDLSVFDGTIGSSPFDRLSVVQQIADIKAFQGEDFNDQIGELSEEGKVITVDPQKSPKAWSSLCAALTKTLKTELEPFLYLDEAA